MTQEYLKKEKTATHSRQDGSTPAPDQQGKGAFLVPKDKSLLGLSTDTHVTTEKRADIDDYDEWMDKAYKEWAFEKEKDFANRKSFKMKGGRIYAKKARLKFYT